MFNYSTSTYVCLFVRLFRLHICDVSIYVLVRVNEISFVSVVLISILVWFHCGAWDDKTIGGSIKVINIKIDWREKVVGRTSGYVSWETYQLSILTCELSSLVMFPAWHESIWERLSFHELWHTSYNFSNELLNKHVACWTGRIANIQSKAAWTVLITYIILFRGVASPKWMGGSNPR